VSPLSDASLTYCECSRATVKRQQRWGCSGITTTTSSSVSKHAVVRALRESQFAEQLLVSRPALCYSSAADSHGHADGRGLAFTPRIGAMQWGLSAALPGTGTLTTERVEAMKGSASVRVTVVVFALAMIAAGTAVSSAGSVPAAIAKGASGPSLVQFVRPATRAAQAEAAGDIPPVGVLLYTGSASSNRFVELDEQLAPGTGCCDSVNDPKIYYAVIDRRSLQIMSSGSVGADLAGFRDLGTVIKAYRGGLNHLVVLNWNGFGPEIDAERNAFSAVLQTIGTAPLTDAQRQALVRRRDSVGEPKFGSAIGVVGAPAGSSYVTSALTRLDDGGMWGYLRRNGVTGKYDFVFTRAVAFDTEANQTPTDSSPSQLTIKIGAQSYTEPNPGGGVSGFHLLTLDANTLTQLVHLHQAVYTTDTASGAEQPDEVQRLASDLNRAADDPSRPLVILQAFGAPHGADRPWGEAAKAIARLGGTLQVFNAMNAVDPRALNGEDPNRRGPTRSSAAWIRARRWPRRATRSTASRAACRGADAGARRRLRPDVRRPPPVRRTSAGRTLCHLRLYDPHNSPARASIATPASSDVGPTFRSVNNTRKPSCLLSARSVAVGVPPEMHHSPKLTWEGSGLAQAYVVGFVLW
jgi:hypothetical protein